MLPFRSRSPAVRRKEIRIPRIFQQGYYTHVFPVLQALFPMDQTDREIVYIGSGRPGDNQTADRLKSVVGVVLRKGVVNLDPLLRKTEPCFSVGISARRVGRAVCSVASDAEKSGILKSRDPFCGGKGEFLIPSAFSFSGKPDNGFSACDKGEGAAAVRVAFEDGRKEFPRFRSLTAEAVGQKNRRIAEGKGGFPGGSAKLSDTSGDD